MYSKTREIPERIPIQEKTSLPNYVDQRVGHHTSHSGLHFHGQIGQRNPESILTQGKHGGLGGTDTRVRNHATYQSSIFTMHNYQKAAPAGEQSRQVPFVEGREDNPTRSARHFQPQAQPQASQPPKGYQGFDREMTQVFTNNGRADHVETVIKPTYPEPLYLNENTTYKTKHAVDGFPRHQSPRKVKEPVGKISSTHWNAVKY